MHSPLSYEFDQFDYCVPLCRLTAIHTHLPHPLVQEKKGYDSLRKGESFVEGA